MNNHNISGLGNVKDRYPLRAQQHTNKCFNVLRKIKSFVASIFERIGTFFSRFSWHGFDAMDNEIMGGVKKKIKPIKTPDLNPKPSKKKEKIHHKAQTVSEEKPLKVPETLQDFHGTTTGIIGNVLEAVHEHGIKPKLSNLTNKKIEQYSESFLSIIDEKSSDKEETKEWFTEMPKESGVVSNGIKNFMGKVRDVGKNDKKLFYELIKTYQPNQQISEELYNMIVCLKKGVEFKDFFFAKGVRNEGENNLIKSLFNQKNEQVFSCNEEEFKKVMLQLLDFRIKSFANKCEERIVNNAPQTIENILLKDGKSIADSIISRISNVLDQTDFPGMFENIFKIFRDHINLVATSEKHKKEQLIRIEKRIEDAESVSGNKKNRAINQEEAERLKEFLKNVNENEGGKEQFLQKKEKIAKQEHYAKQNGDEPFCELEISKLINDPLNVKKDQEEIYGKIADDIYPLIFPKKKIKLENGEIKYVDGLVYHIYKTYKFGELHDLFEEASEIFKYIHPKETDVAFEQINKIFKNEIVKNAFSEVGNAFEGAAQNILIGEIKRKLASVMEFVFEEFINPKNRDEFFINTIFPLLQEQMLIVMGKGELEKCAKQFFNNASNEDILELVYQETKKSMVNYGEELDEEQFKKLLEPEVIAIKQKIEQEHDEQEKTLESVTLSLNDYFKSVDQKSNAIFGEIAEGLICDLGQFGGVVKSFFGWLKGMISGILSNATHDLQKDHNFLMEKITNKLKDFNKEKIDGKIKSLFAEEEENEIKTKKEENELKIEEKIEKPTIKKEIRKTAKIAHDLVFSKIPRGGLNLYLKAATKVIGNNEDHLNQVITNIYTKLFENHEEIGEEQNLSKDRLTQNLLLKVCNTFFGSLRRGANVVNDWIAPIQETKVPTLIPSFF